MKAKVTVTNVAVGTTYLLLGTCDCTVNSDVGTGDFSFARGIMQVCGHAHVRSHVSQDMDCSREFGNLFRTFLTINIELEEGS